MPYVGTKTAKTLAAQAKGPRGQERKQGDIFCPLESIYQKHIKIDGITLTACIYDAHCALIGFEYYEYCSFASHTYPICVHNARRKTGAGFLPNTRFSALNPVFSHFLKIAVFFIFWPVPKPSAPLQISSSKALPSTVQECQTPCKYGVLTISTHSLSSSPNPTHPSPKTVYLRPFPSIPVYEIFGGCVQKDCTTRIINQIRSWLKLYYSSMIFLE